MQPKAAFSASRETLLLARNLRESRLALRPHNQGRFCGARFASNSPRIGLCSAPASQDSPRAAITAARVACLLGEVFPARAADFGCKMPLRSDDGNPSRKETTGRQPDRRSVPSPPDSPLPNGRPGKRACSNKHMTPNGAAGGRAILARARSIRAFRGLSEAKRAPQKRPCP